MLEDALLWAALWWALHSMITRFYELPSWFCLKCFCFWLTLVITLNPFIAAGSALTIYFIEKNDSIKL